jgi:hypothetical protein
MQAQWLYRYLGLSPIPRPDPFHTRSNSHPVAARSDCTNIPRAAGGAQEDETILLFGFFKPCKNRGSSTRIRQD